MNFSDFLNEGLSTAHGKVEMAIRESGLKYTIDENDNTSKIFDLPNDYYIRSYNSGTVVLSRKNIKGSIDEFKTFNFSDVRELTSKMIAKHIDAIKSGKTAKVDTKTKELA